MKNATHSLHHCLILLVCLMLGNSAQAQDTARSKFLKGPARAQMGAIGQLEVPVGFQFLDGKSTRELMKAEGEPVSGQEQGLLVPTNSGWSVIFEFSDMGYVKDDDKDKLDADKLLQQIKEGTEEANKERVAAGNSPLVVIGWELPPKYDSTSHNLEWAIRAESEGRPILNYNTRLLGRKGVMEVVLIVEPDRLKETLPEYRKVLAGYSFQTGQSYAEYRPGDKVAKYGLAALVLGGAAVGAAKLGLLAWVAVFFKKAWKLVVLGVAGIATFVKKFFGRRTDRQE
ncbi:MAG: DUF2167 domain-containing protein [Verrucomicrobiota bacterium]